MSQELFDNFFQSVYKERYLSLKQALLEIEGTVARVNGFSELDSEHPILKEEKFLTLNAYKIPDRNTYQAREGKNSLLDLYFMDPGSIFVALSLKVNAGDFVLDMCAAPGGKTLIIAEGLKESGELFANEISEHRRSRLKKVIQDYVPREIRERIWVKGSDGMNYGMKSPNHFDKILLDAPCSGEKHLLQNPKEMKDWSKKRTENLAKRQYGLLCSAMLALKPGGRLVYSTCSISPLENDGVIQRFLERKGDTAKLIQEVHPAGEKTDFGTIFLPDHSGFGPLYYTILEKN